jgi:hypothetical protein
MSTPAYYLLKGTDDFQIQGLALIVQTQLFHIETELRQKDIFS